MLTRGDLRDRVDKDLTDLDVFVRNGSYYRGLFAKHLLPLGGGLHVMVGNERIGGLGLCGAPTQEADDKCAAQAIKSAAAMLK